MTWHNINCNLSLRRWKDWWSVYIVISIDIVPTCSLTTVLWTLKSNETSIIFHLDMGRHEFMSHLIFHLNIIVLIKWISKAIMYQIYISPYPICNIYQHVYKIIFWKKKSKCFTTRYLALYRGFLKKTPVLKRQMEGIIYNATGGILFWGCTSGGVYAPHIYLHARWVTVGNSSLCCVFVWCLLSAN